jgi:lysylphosphatidylglycerol synthetase-like protein (DUF2156 family)
MFDRGTRPPRARVEAVADAEREVREVLNAHGSQAGHFSVLGPDPWRIIWNAQRTGFIAFLEARRCILSWRSPVAPVADHLQLVGDLLDYARATRRQLLCVAIGESALEAGRSLGMIPTWIGTECFIDLPTWSIEGGRRQKVRWARSHAAKLGYTWREAVPLRSEEDFTALARVEELWKEERPERRTDSFLRNSFVELMHLRRYFLCEGPEGVVASVTCSPMNAKAWYLQDPVRAPRAPRGALEGAMALALDTFRDEGYAVASNGPLPFWDPAVGKTNTKPLGPLTNRVFAYFDRRYRFHHISQFRSKIVADHTEPCYVVRSHRLVTPGVARSLTALLTKPPAL